MSDHITEWLNAYHDGELTGKRLAQVESHLGECADCQAELAALQALSGLLVDEPLPEFTASERFAANLTLSLPRTSRKPVARTLLEWVWWLTPVTLVGAWIFVQTTLLISNWVSAADGIGLLNQTALAWLTPTTSQPSLFNAMLGQAGLVSGNSLHWLATFETIADSLISQLVIQGSISLLFVGWIATWWARQRRRGYGQPLAAATRPQVK